MSIYKIYSPDGTAHVFDSLKVLRRTLGLDADEASRCYYSGCHQTRMGIVITFAG